MLALSHSTPKSTTDLYANLNSTPEAFDWLLDPEIKTLEDFRLFCLSREQLEGHFHFVTSKIGLPGDYVGINSLRSPNTRHKKLVLELGLYSSKLQSTSASTESYYLLMRYIFGELGFNKITVTNILPQNKRAIHTLERLGFTFVLFSHDGLVVKGFAFNITRWRMLESKWQGVKRGFEYWLAPDNFDS